MISAENFPVCKQSTCSRPTYESDVRSTCRADHLRKTTQLWTGGDRVPSRRLTKVRELSRDRIPPAFCCRSYNPKEEVIDLFDEPELDIGENASEKNNFLREEVPENKLECEQLRMNDNSSDELKPLKIDLTVLKVPNPSKSPNLIRTDFDHLNKCYFSELFQMPRTSLSRGGLLTKVENFRKTSTFDCVNKGFLKLSGVALNVFSLENLIEVHLDSGSVTQFLNKISPASLPCFDLSVQKEEGDRIASVVSSEEGKSKNPFKNFTAEERNAVTPTNPFNDVRDSPSLNENIAFVSPGYENIRLPQKSSRQCYTTRSASSIMRAPEKSAVSNPFLLNDATPELCSSATPPIFTDGSRLPASADSLRSSNSFILAVPVFPIFQQLTTDSSTQTVDSSKATTLEDPADKNVNQLRKFMKSNDRSLYDLQCLIATLTDLRNSGWYHENLTWHESVTLLTDTEPGTFLIRDSSDPNFLFSLSVQTFRGPTSVRIHYGNGQFRLDAEEKLISQMPSFNSVTELIDYYVENTSKSKSNVEAKSENKPPEPKWRKSTDQVWIDSLGNVYSAILLVKPLYKKNHFSPLQHLARLTINRLIRKKLNAKTKFNFRVTPVYESHPFQNNSFQNNFDNFCPILNVDFLPLPSKLLDYLKEYPFCH